MKYIVILFSIIVAVPSGISFSSNEKYQKLFNNYKGDYILQVSKRKFQLSVYHRKLHIVKTFYISYGKNLDKRKKLHEGDERTPEGVYFITEILSSSALKNSDSYIRLKKLNNIEFKARDGFSQCGKPGIDQGKNVYGPRLYYINYPNSEDKKKYKQALHTKRLVKIKKKNPRIGFGIAIHGTNEPGSIGRICSKGCIRMRNKDILALDSYIRLGMPVIIEGD